MFEDLSDLRESLFAVRLLREQIAATPLRPDLAARLRSTVRSENARAPLSSGAIDAVVRLAAARPDRIDEALLARVATAAGGGGRRRNAGTPFHGRAAPPPARLDELVAEMLDTLNAPVAVEVWPPIVRAFAAHFLLRIVQPFDGPPAAVGAAAEALLLAVDGLPPDRFLLPEPDLGADVPAARPDPDAFLRSRLERLLERLGETSDRVRELTARAALLAWVDEKEARLNARQRRLVRWLAEGDSGRSISFREYVRLHAGRRAPSLRSLQRDWKALRERRLLTESGGRLAAGADALAFGVR